MPTKYRPTLLRRLLAWRAQRPQHDPADMGTDIGLEYILAQAHGEAIKARAPAANTPRPWQGGLR
jgi:hypothetical protein